MTDRAPLPATLTPELEEILGRPNFTCAGLAEVHRVAGATIAFKAEAEQAFVIFWLLGLYLDHGHNWRKVAREFISRTRAAIGGKVAS